MKTSELNGAALDWAVAKCEGDLLPSGGVMLQTWPKYSTNWAQGGPIIEREQIGIDCDDQGVWFASYDLSADCSVGAAGDTPLIAAMRCYVSSILGDVMNIPEELK